MLRLYGFDLARKRITRNPHPAAVGISTTGKPFVIGGTQFADVFDQTFFGSVGDVRIVKRALRVDEFMTARGHRKSF